MSWTFKKNTCLKNVLLLKYIFAEDLQKIWIRDFPGGPVAGLRAPNIRGLGLIPVWGTRSHMLQLRLSEAK